MGMQVLQDVLHLRSQIADTRLRGSTALQEKLSAVRRFHTRDPIAWNHYTDGPVILVEGFAGRFSLLRDGRRQIVSFLLPGDVCDFGSVPQKSHMPIVSLTPTTVGVISGTLYEHAFGRTVEHGRFVEAEIARQWIVNVGARTALERVAHLLCELFTRLQAVGLTSADSCTLPVTQSAMADALGLTSVHVNRTLMILRHQRLATLRHQTLIIHDHFALLAVAGFDPGYLHLDSPFVGLPQLRS